MDGDVSSPMISLRQVSKTFVSHEITQAVTATSFNIKRGEFVSLLGPSGCGKSTLLRIICGLLAPSTGEVRVRGVPVTGPQTDFGVVFQNPILLEWLAVLENVMLQMAARKGDPERARRRALDLLDNIGLKGHERKMPSELSGGMQQRVSLCRALLHDPEVLVMDEPFGALDAITRDQMCLDLQQLWAEGEKTVVFVTHDIAEAVFLSDRVIIMASRPGRVDLDLKIELDRPRKLSTRDTSSFVEYCREIRRSFERQGVFREHA